MKKTKKYLPSFIIGLLIILLISCGGGGGGGGNSDDKIPPSTPTGLSAAAVSSTQINLSWNPSTDNVGVAGYKIYRNGIYLKTASTTSSSDNGLNPSTAYNYNVSSYDGAGNESAQSNQATATTNTNSRATISGTVIPPPGISPSSLTMVALGEISSITPQGNYSAKVYSDGVAVISAMPADKEFGLMNVVVSTPSADLLIDGKSPKINFLAADKKDLNSIPVNVKTTAVSMVFLTPYFLTNDNQKASDILNIIENDFKVIQLASVIETLFNTSDPYENEIFKNSFINAIISVLDTIQLKKQSIKNKLIKQREINPKTIILPKINKASDIEPRDPGISYSTQAIDMDYIKLNISESNGYYRVDLDSPQKNAVDWIGEIAQLKIDQFISIEDLNEKAKEKRNLYDRQLTIGRDRALAKGFLRWIDFIGTLIDSILFSISDLFSFDSVGISSSTQGIYIVRAFSGSGWGADSDERGFIPSVPNGNQNDINAFSLNIISIVLDSLGIVVDLENSVDNQCMGNVTLAAMKSLSGGVYTFTNIEDLISFVPGITKDTIIASADCLSKPQAKNIVKNIGKIAGLASKEMASYLSMYKWFELLGSVGKIIERIANMYYYVTPLESIFIVVGSPFVGDVIKPTIPTNLTANPLSSTQIALSWAASIDNVQVIGYNIYRDGIFRSNIVQATSFIDTGLTPNTQYRYTVRAYDAAGNYSDYSGPAYATTFPGGDNTFPSPPKNMRVISGGLVGQIRLAWDANIEADLSHYIILYGTNPGIYPNNVIVNFTAGNTVYYTLAGLIPGQQYYIVCRAVDTSNNPSLFSNEVYGVAVQEPKDIIDSYAQDMALSFNENNPSLQISRISYLLLNNGITYSNEVQRINALFNEYTISNASYTVNQIIYYDGQNATINRTVTYTATNKNNGCVYPGLTSTGDTFLIYENEKWKAYGNQNPNFLNPSVKEAFSCSAIQGTCQWEPVGISDHFSGFTQSTSYIYVFLRLQDFLGNEAIRMDWYAPSGVLFYTTGDVILEGPNYAYRNINWYSYIYGPPSFWAANTGTWSVDIYINNIYQRTVSFSYSL